MASEKRISGLSSLTGASVAPATDLIPTVDTSEGKLKKITYEEFGKAIPAASISSPLYGEDTGIADAYVVALTPAPAAYVAPMIVLFKAAHANTGASTLKVGSLAATAIKKSGNTALGNGDITGGQIVMVVYDGTNFQLIR